MRETFKRIPTLQSLQKINKEIIPKCYKMFRDREAVNNMKFNLR